MRKSHVLATVSVIALSTGMAVSGAKASPIVSNLTLDWTLPAGPTLTTEVGSYSAAATKIQDNNNKTDIAAKNTTTGIGGQTKSVADGTITLNVDKNTDFSTAIANTFTDSVDLWVATGSADTSAAIAATLQMNRALTEINADVTGASLFATTLDLGAGSAQTLDTNAIRATATGNIGIDFVSGDLNPLLSSTEIGQSNISDGNATNLNASATILAATGQFNDNLVKTTATISDSFITSLATVDGAPTTALVGVDLSVQDNTIAAAFTGNNGTTTVDLDNDLDVKQASDTILNGTIGVVNAQQNTTAATTFSATVNGSNIEAGATKGGINPIDDLSGTKLDFTGNDITAAATGSTAVNTLHDDGVSIVGTFPGAGKFDLGQDFTGLVAAGGSKAQALAFGDVYVDSYQWGEVTVNAAVGNTKDSDLNVLVEDVANSTVLAGSVGDGNTIGSSATGHDVTNSIDIEGVTNYKALTTLVSAQVTNTGNKQTASTNGDLTVSVATQTQANGTVLGVVDGSAIKVEGNSLYSEAITNTGANTIEIDATTVTGIGVDPDFQMARSWHSNLIARSTSDITLINGQQVEDSTVTSNTTASIIVDVADLGGAAGSKISNTSISASSNGVSALTVGNMIDENSITVADAATFNASVGLVSFQLTQDNAGGAGLAMSAAVSPGDASAIVQVQATAAKINDPVLTKGVADAISADKNVISAQVFGNLVAGDTNSINISGVTVGDNNMGARTASPSAIVDRQTEGDNLPQTGADSGFVLISDQSFEDSLNNPVKASISGNFVTVEVGSTATSILTDIDVSASSNKVTGAVALNTSNNAINVDAQSLNANSSLVNTQTFWDEENQGDGAGSIVVDLGSGDIFTTVNAGATDIDDIHAEVNSNTVLASGRINLATNAMSIDAGTQTITGILANKDVPSVSIGKGLSTLRAENGVLNDQAYNGLIAGGVNVDLSGNSASLTIATTDGDFTDSTAEVDGNSFRAQALGNDALNMLALDVGTYDLSASVKSNDGNPPIGVILNAQRAYDSFGTFLYTAPLDAAASGVGVTVDVSGVDGIGNSQISVDGNSVRTLARVNNASNVLTVTGTTYEPVANGTSPAVEAQGVPGGASLDAKNYAFGIGSYQLNGNDVNSTVTSGFATLVAQGPLVTTGPATVTGSALSVDGNSFVAEARGNDNSNQASVTYTTNYASAFVANVQEGDDGLAGTVGDSSTLITATATGNTISIDADATTENFDKSSVSVSGNAIAALASANRVLINSLEVDGTNLYSGSTDNTPFAAIDPANVGTADVTVNSDLAVLNVQGAPSVTADQTEDVVAFVSGNTLNAVIDQVDTGSVTVDNNLVLGQGVIHSATNLLGAGVDYSFNSAGKLVVTDLGHNTNIAGATGAVISQQIVTAGSSVDVDVASTVIETDIQSIAGTGAVAATISGNQVRGEGIGATSTNRIDAVTGASITGVVGTPTPVLGDLTAGNPLVVNADFGILNYQAGEPDVDTDVTGTDILMDLHSKLSGDAVTMQSNVVNASSTGFNTSNVIVLDAGSSSDTTANVANRQDQDNAAVTASVSDTGIRAFSESALDSGAENSSVRVLNNVVSADAGGNVALNALVTSAGASLQESSGAGSTINPAAAQTIAVTNSDYSVLNWQSIDGTAGSGVVSATNTGTTITIDDFSGSTGVDSSSLAVTGNEVTASAVGNSAVNSLVLNTGTFQHPSASIASLQTTSGATISASVSGATVGIGNSLLINANSSNSSFSVQGNSVGATAIGNSGSNSITGN